MVKYSSSSLGFLDVHVLRNAWSRFRDDMLWCCVSKCFILYRKMRTSATVKVPTTRGKRWLNGLTDEAKTSERIVSGFTNERSRLHPVLRRKTPFITRSSRLIARNPPRMNVVVLAFGAFA